MCSPFFLETIRYLFGSNVLRAQPDAPRDATLALHPSIFSVLVYCTETPVHWVAIRLDFSIFVVERCQLPSSAVLGPVLQRGWDPLPSLSVHKYTSGFECTLCKSYGVTHQRYTAHHEYSRVGKRIVWASSIGCILHPGPAIPFKCKPTYFSTNRGPNKTMALLTSSVPAAGVASMSDLQGSPTYAIIVHWGMNDLVSNRRGTGLGGTAGMPRV